MAPPKENADKKTWTRILWSETLFPLLIMTLVPNCIVLVMYQTVIGDGSLISPLVYTPRQSVLDAWAEASKGFTDVFCWSFVLVLSVWAWISIVYLPGKRYLGPVVGKGYRPVYYKSGPIYYVLSMLIFGGFLLAYDDIGRHFYSKLVQLSGTLILFGYIVTTLLYIKGLVSPSAGPHGSSGNPIFDYYWGLELHPRIGEYFDLKQWHNNRFGLMILPWIVMACWKAQVETSGWNWAMAASSLIQLAYVAKFYWWEDSYMHTIDIMVDRSGFYLAWGCIAFYGTLLNTPAPYLVRRSPTVSPIVAAIMLIFGFVATFLTYAVDYQRTYVRQNKGKCTVWGKPARVIHATYKDEAGTERKSILIVSGFWGLSRHFNYCCELSSLLSFAFPAFWNFGIIPLLPTIVIGIIIVHRLLRDDRKCSAKYGQYWQQYCKLVPYRMIPYVF